MASKAKKNQVETPSGEGQGPLFYVGVGASAGGLEAIEALFNEMPSDTGMAFVVIQHLSPDYKSMMVELLSKRTDMPVIRAEDGMSVEPNHVYLIPPKVNLTIFHGKLLLSEQDHKHGLNLPIDIFLRSLAEDQGRRSVGIVLSGTGSDGMRGVRAIKEAGGMVMIQTAESAKFDGMPRSAISTGLADFILPSDKMAEQLVKFSRSPLVAKADYSRLSTAETDLDRIFAMLREKHKVDFTHYKPSTVNRRIERRMTVNQTDTLQEYVRLLEQMPRELTMLYRELLIGVTSFFRDSKAFDILSQSALPDLFEEMDKRSYRFWVAGCSTGEEAYSLAILCREYMQASGKSFDFKIFATDIDQDAILTAGNGVYPASLIADLPVELQQKYFRAHNGDYQVVRELREQIVFAQHNVISDPPFTNIDMVSCRNLLIYLEPVLQEKVQDLFNFSLNPGGVLFLGSSETPGRHLDAFDPIDQKWRIYKSKGRRMAPRDGVVPRPLFRAGPPVRLPGSVRPRVEMDDSRFLDRLLQTLIVDYVPLVLVVNEQMELVYTLGNTTDLLAVPVGRLQYGISKMLPREISIPLTTSVQRAIRKGEDVAFTNIRFSRDDVSRHLNLRVKLLPAKKTQEPLVAVLIEDASTDASSARHEEEPAFDFESGVQQRIGDLEQELQFTKENLQATIEELETSNEELQATNEELLASNEELQSTNEELQSVNEELHTVNAEHQMKIVELTEMTNDMDNLLGNTRQAILFLDENFEIRKFTPETSDIFKIRAVDTGRPLEHLNHRLRGVEHPVELAKQVAKTRVPVECEVSNEEGCVFLMRILPYEIAPEQFAGLVFTFTNVSRLRAAEADLALLKQAAQMAQVGSWEYVVDTGDVIWSEEVYAIHDQPLDYKPVLSEGLAYYAPESRPLIERVFKAACEQGEPYDEVLEIISAKGVRKWVRSIANPEMKDGKVVRVTGAFQDVTRVKRMEEQLAEIEAGTREKGDGGEKTK